LWQKSQKAFKVLFLETQIGIQDDAKLNFYQGIFLCLWIEIILFL
jgi:hypothetical protein